MTQELTKVKLIGCDGNAFAVLGKCKRAATNNNWGTERWEKFHQEATAGDYNHLLVTVMAHFDVE
jgi:hypothetical protein